MKKRDLYFPPLSGYGCRDGNCILQDNSEVVHTNGGCQCEKEIRRTSKGLAAIRTIQYLRTKLKGETE